jgi:hypothetical protein
MENDEIILLVMDKYAGKIVKVFRWIYSIASE